jgi:hypothetical protein
VQERFDALIDRIQGRLDAEYARNVKEKRAVIERAQRLGSADDSRSAIEGVKELQRRWKTIGPVPRDEDRRLWDEFRQHCDAGFERRQQESAEFAAALLANKTRALGVCEELEAIGGLSGPQLLERAARLAGIREEFEAIGDFPRADSRDLHRRFERGLERCERAVSRQKSVDAEQGWMDLLAAADHVRAYRLATARNEDAQALKEQAENRLASLQHVPKGGMEALRNGLQRAGGTDPAANESALRMLCIRAEILTELPTPAEDQLLRRQYQVNRLVQSMGQGIGADVGRLDELTLEWVGIGPTEDSVYARLLSRFLQC